MAATTYREKRRVRKHTTCLTSTPATPRPPVEPARLIPLGTVASLGLEGASPEFDSSC
jgi:hypothetical protein